MSYRPLPETVTIGESDIHGFGLIATRHLSVGYYLGVIRYEDLKFGGGVIRTPLGGFLNHSETPNCEIFKWTTSVDAIVVGLQTMQPIEAGEELTLLYSLYDPLGDSGNLDV